MFQILQRICSKLFDFGKMEHLNLTFNVYASELNPHLF